MPDRGEQRTVNGETRQWTGSRWESLVAPPSVDNPVSFGFLDKIPGLRDAMNIPINVVKGAKALPDAARGLIHEPGATLKGFAQGASEAATPGRVGLFALLTGGATVPAALAAGGGEALAEGTRSLTSAPNASKSFPEAAGNVAEAASVPALAGAIKAVPGAVERMGGTANVARRVVGAGVGGYAGYKADGIPGAVIGAATGGMGLKGLRSAMGLAAPEAGAATPAIVAAEAAAPMTKGDWISARESRFPFQKEELPYRMEGTPSQNPAELFPYQKDAIAASESQTQPTESLASIRGLLKALNLPSDADMMESVSKRNASGRW